MWTERPCPPYSPRVLAMPVFTLDVLTWLIRFSCSGLTKTATLMFHSDCMAIWVEGSGSPLPWAGALSTFRPPNTPAYTIDCAVSHRIERSATPFS